MKSIVMIKTRNPIFALMVLVTISITAAYGEVVLNTIYALVSTKNDFSFLSRFLVNLVQLLTSSAIIYFLTNKLFTKIDFWEIHEEVNFSKIIVSRWPALFLIFPIIANNQFMLIERSLIFVLLFALFIILYLFFQIKNYLVLIKADKGNLFNFKKIFYLSSLLVSDLIFIKLLQLIRFQN